MKLDLNGKAALVSGGSRGIGLAITRTLAEEGCDVLAVSRSASAHRAELDRIAADTGRTIRAFDADLSIAPGAGAAMKEMECHFGQLDILVNNAGDARRGNLLSVTDADWEAGFALKFHGTLRLTRAAWPLLLASKGSIVNVIGVSGRTPEAVYTIAAAVNAALYAFTKSTAELAAGTGIRVNAVNPSVVETERLVQVLAGLGLPDAEARARLLQLTGAPRIAQPEEVASIVAYLASNCASAINGAIIDVDGGRTKGL